MINRTKALVLVAIVVAVVGGVTLGIAVPRAQHAKHQQEIAAYLEQFKPTIPEGVAYSESHSLLPERPITENIEQFGDLIVRGRVTKVSDPYRDEHGLINHTVSVHTSTVFKGGELAKVEQIIEVGVLGGSLDGVVSYSLESPHFVEGEEVIIFLRKGEDSYFIPFEAYGKVLISDGKAIGIDDEKGVFEMPIAEYENELRRYIAT